VAQQQITDIPAPEVGNVVQDFVVNGQQRITVERQGDGSYTVTAE
jgi:hypothetical protein